MERAPGGASRRALDLASIGLSAALLTWSLPPHDLHLLAWIALVPALLAIFRSGRVGAFCIPFATCYAFDFAHASWMLRIEGIDALNMGLPVLVHASYFGVFGWAARALHRRVPAWDPLTLPAAWVALEYFRFHLGFLSFPWGVLAYSQYAVLPVAGVAAWTGIHGVSFLIVLANVLAADAIESGRPLRRRARLARSLAAAGVAAAVVLLLPGAPGARTGPTGPERLRVALVQSGARPGSERAAGQDEGFATYAALTRRAAESGPALVAWPESSVRGRLPHDRDLARDLSALARESGAALLVGTSGQNKALRGHGEASAANSAFLIGADGVPAGRYDKIRLLPFHEYLPLRGVVSWPSWIVGDVADAVPGTERTVFDLDGARFGVLICWENLFPEGFRRAAADGLDFVVSMTNESFADSPGARRQMLAMNVFRAIENRVAVVRAANTGVSALIEPDGRIAGRVRDERGEDVNAEGLLVAEVPLSRERSFYTRHGDWFVSLCAVLSAGALLASLRLRPVREEASAAARVLGAVRP